MSPSNTVFDRYKKTGYITGSRHAMGPALEEGAPPPPESDGMSPPNLRDSGSDSDSCGTCANFSQNHCDKFDVDLTPNLVCDAFEAQGGPDEDAAPLPGEATPQAGPPTA